MKISKSRKLRTKYEIKCPEEIQTVLEKLKQAIPAKAARLRRYQKRSRFYKDNDSFKNNPKQFYRNIEKPQIKKNIAPSGEEICLVRYMRPKRSKNGARLPLRILNIS